MLLEQAKYSDFWTTMESDDVYADLTSDVSGFEELMRVRIAVTVGQSCREVGRSVLEEWLNLRALAFENFVVDICGWGVDSGPDAIRTKTARAEEIIRVPVNKENEAKGSVVREEVNFEQFSRIIKRAWEEPA